MKKTSIDLPSVSTPVVDEESIKYGVRKGVILEKGVAVTYEKMVEWEDHLREKFQFYTAYPDRFEKSRLSVIDRKNP